MQKYVKLVERSDIGELEIQHEGLTIRIKKNRYPVMLEAPVRSVPSSIQAPVPIEPVSQPDTQSPPPPPPPSAKTIVEVKSPIVGTFYYAPSPEASPYVQTGDEVHPGTVLCIIEAMKLMNEIESEVTGKIVEIMVENAHPVEFDQVLFRIEKK
ncbi:acetyl-CoA carboxylase biotin carboxyl carrier protein [bacterium]|nr:acetyl-CoA carboxylase biotin carboxyl carrier protein [bacterium]